MGGIRSSVSGGTYCSTKFAIEGITEALGQEIAPFGIRTIIVEPGYFRTNVLANPAAGINIAKPMKEYDGTIAHEVATMYADYNLKQPGNPVLGAARILEFVSGEGMAKSKKQLLRLPLGSDAGAEMKGLAEEYAETAREYEDIWKSTNLKE
jgi:NAD(P)-dependent dehydrogenase (short-subunit alcohol dehydrogenase family)